MGGELTSRERVELAYSVQEPDRVPIVFRGIKPMEHHWKDDVERAEYLLGLGADDVLSIEAPVSRHPDVVTRVWREAGGRYPVLHKEWQTPAGSLHASATITADWPAEDIPLISDHLWARGVEPMVKTKEDLEALDYVLSDPREDDLVQFREYAAAKRKEAERLGVILQGSTVSASIYAMGFLGGQRRLTIVRDEPELFAELIAGVQRWSRGRLALLLEVGVDVIYRSGCYDTVDFYSPKDVRTFFMPALREDVSLCHQAGVRLHNFVQTGGMPFLEDYAELGVDVLSSLDTRGTNPMNLAEVKRRIGQRCCLMGGVDNREPFLFRPASDMEGTVLEALRVMAPGGGYILSTAGMIFAEGKEENVIAFIEAGRRYGRYPLSLPE